MWRPVALLLIVAAAVLAHEDPVLLRERAIGLIAMGNYADAEPLLARALSLREHQAGTDDPTLAPLIDELAALYRAEGRNPDAEKLYQRSLALKTKSAGTDTTEIIPDLKLLGNLYVTMGRFADAERQ